MDINAAIAEMRSLTTAMLDEERVLNGVDASRLAELFDAIDEWLSAGNMLPGAWAEARPS